METVFIYVLKEPETGEIRYVGKTARPKERLRKHVVHSKRNSNHRECWIFSLLSRNERPVFEIIDEVPIEYWSQWEVAWIEFYREQGANLVNSAPGGGGNGAGELSSFFGKRHTSVTRKKMSLSAMGHTRNVGKKQSPETVAKRAALHLGMKRSEQAKQNISRSHMGNKNCVGRKLSEETKQKIGDKQRAFHAKRKLDVS